MFAPTIGKQRSRASGESAVSRQPQRPPARRESSAVGLRGPEPAARGSIGDGSFSAHFARRTSASGGTETETEYPALATVSAPAWVLQRTAESPSLSRYLTDRLANPAGESLLPYGESDEAGVVPRGAVRPTPDHGAPVHRLQAKLMVGRSDDPAESEADRVADDVMRPAAFEPHAPSAGPRLDRGCAACGDETPPLRPKLATTPATDAHEAPALVHETLRAPGQPLDPAVRDVLEPRFRRDFHDVRVHTGAAADASTRSVNSLAYTVGRDIVFRAGQYAPGTASGQRLLAHELTHVMQQAGASPGPADRVAGRRSPALGDKRVPTGSLVQRVPAPPVPATCDRSKIAIGDVADFLATQSGGTWTFPPNSVSITVSEPSVAHIVWELYDATDQFVDGFGTVPSSPRALTQPFPIDLNNRIRPVMQGRWTLRCTGLNGSHSPVAYADRSFFIWTAAPGPMQDLATLNAVKAAPASHSLGEVGAAYARSMMLEHQASLASGGPGTVQGNQCTSAAPAGVSQQDCTTYVIDVLRNAFNAKGKGADWTKVMAAAAKGSGGALKGTEVLRALETVAGWKAVFWSPDPRNPADLNPEHSAAYKKVRGSGQYYGVDVDSPKSIVEYRRTAVTKPDTLTGIDKLKNVPLGVIAAKGGRHMTLILNGQVYEVHWDKPASDPNVIEATPLERWGWNSGVIVMPAEDYAKAF
jgi:Domain of unknown function (DUF4157)